MSQEIGKELAEVSRGYYGYKVDNSIFAGGNPGTALMGKYIAESNRQIAWAIKELAVATQALADRPIQVNITMPEPKKRVAKRPKAKK